MALQKADIKICGERFSSTVFNDFGDTIQVLLKCSSIIISQRLDITVSYFSWIDFCPLREMLHSPQSSKADEQHRALLLTWIEMDHLTPAVSSAKRRYIVIMFSSSGFQGTCWFYHPYQTVRKSRGWLRQRS